MITLEKFQEIFEGDSCLEKYHDDNAILGLNIIRKYMPTKGIEGADHDIIYSVLVDEIIESGITEEDVRELRNLNWMIESHGLACFV